MRANCLVQPKGSMPFLHPVRFPEAVIFRGGSRNRARQVGDYVVESCRVVWGGECQKYVRRV
eukprot:10584848-Alexandrium_andersonii.AAC.1